MQSNQQVNRVNVGQLEIGMIVVELDRPWIESPFTIHGFRIKTDQQINQLRQACAYVYIANPNKNQIDTSGASLKGKKNYRNSQTFGEALPKARSTHRQAKSVVKGLFKSLRLGQSIDTAVAKRTVKQCVDNVIANQEAMVWLGLLKDVDEYTAEHSLNVAMLSIILGRKQGLSPQDLELVGLCGLLHDMGKSEIPLSVLNKEGALTDEEFDLMKTHAERGYHILKDQVDIPAIVAETAHSHHERLNGRGYPQALSADKISYFTRIVTIADAYDAITSTRVYSPAKTALQGLQILNGAKGSHFDPELVDDFVEAIGLYPAGSVAELTTGEVAIVMPTDPRYHYAPNLLIVRNKSKKRCPERVIKLGENPRDEEGEAIKIKHLLSDDAFGIKLKDYHDYLG